MSMLVLLCGPPGSTKTSWRNARFPSSNVLCPDELRAQCTGDAEDPTSNKAVFHILQLLVRERMAHGLVTVVDATNARHVYREALILQARQFRIPVVAVVFDYPVDACMQRIEGRDRKVPRDIVEAIQRDLHASLPKLMTTVDVIAYCTEEGVNIVEAGTPTQCWPKPDIKDVLPTVEGWFSPQQLPLPVRR